MEGVARQIDAGAAADHVGARAAEARDAALSVGAGVTATTTVGGVARRIDASNAARDGGAGAGRRHREIGGSGRHRGIEREVDAGIDDRSRSAATQ